MFGGSVSVRMNPEMPLVQKGWVGTPKGECQFCHERGLIDVAKGCTHCTLDGRSDADGKHIKGASLRRSLESCHDFQNETTMLEFIASEYGFHVPFSPKCHPEVAGVGIECNWSHSKNTLTHIPLEDRRGIVKFKKCALEHCFHRKVLTNQLLRNNARQARGCVVAYLMLHSAVAAKERQEAVADSGTQGKDASAMEGLVTFEALQGNVTQTACNVSKQARRSYKRHRGIALFIDNGD